MSRDCAHLIFFAFGFFARFCGADAFFVSGSSPSSSGSSWCFFFCRFCCCSPAFEGPRLRVGGDVRTSPLRFFVALARVRDAMSGV